MTAMNIKSEGNEVPSPDYDCSPTIWLNDDQRALRHLVAELDRRALLECRVLVGLGEPLEAVVSLLPFFIFDGDFPRVDVGDFARFLRYDKPAGRFGTSTYNPVTQMPEPEVDYSASNSPNTVLLPAPLGPTSATVCPGCTARLKPNKAACAGREG